MVEEVVGGGGGGGGGGGRWNGGRGSYWVRRQEWDGDEGDRGGAGEGDTGRRGTSGGEGVGGEVTRWVGRGLKENGAGEGWCDWRMGASGRCEPCAGVYTHGARTLSLQDQQARVRRPLRPSCSYFFFLLRHLFRTSNVYIPQL